jgi:two-component system sensor histidine kinase UhpB
MPRRWGLQRRIMTYVALGLFAVFAAFLYLGMRAVQQGTRLVFEERLAIVSSVAAALGREIQHIIPDVEEQVAGLHPEADPAQLEAALNDTYLHLTTRDDFTFFRVEGIWLLDNLGRSMVAAPRSAALNKTPPPVPPYDSADGQARVVWPETPGSGRFLSVVVPLVDENGAVWGRVVVDTRGRNSRDTFVPFGSLANRDDGSYVPPISAYHMEVLGPTGLVILGVGPDEVVGAPSVHYDVIGEWMSAGRSGTTLHSVGGRTHVMAAVPVPSSPLYMVLEQDRELALALPAQFREQILLFSVLGFLVALSIAWVTTRSVVRPTELLTRAAERMAGGELSTPIQVRAQDEVKVLAENLELMRQQLKRALDNVETTNRELESRVRERTEQLQELVHRALTAQEDERRRVSLELHDETAQALTALSLALDAMLRRARGATPDETADLREAHHMASETLEGVRRMIHALGPAALERRGVGAALRSYAGELLGRSGLDVRIDVSRARGLLPEDIQLALYRIGQEALNNVAGHAQAAHARVVLVSDDGHATLTVTDDGVGFDPARQNGMASGTRGLGIAGMRERAGLVGGTFTIESAPGHGTTVRVKVPIPADG